MHQLIPATRVGFVRFEVWFPFPVVQTRWVCAHGARPEGHRVGQQAFMFQGIVIFGGTAMVGATGALQTGTLFFQRGEGGVAGG